MSFRESGAGARVDSDDVGAVYGLAEQARLRCEVLTAQSAAGPERAALRRIHRELGMAGWLTGAELDADFRRWLLADARDRSLQATFGARNHARALVATVILAEDVVARLLTDGLSGDWAYSARLHLVTAEALLYGHLQPRRVSG